MISARRTAFYGFSFLFLFLVLLFRPQSSFCQASRLNFKHISSEHGLSNTTIETIFQDSRGFMWFGTRDGLNCYDGYQIKVFRNKAGDSSTLSDNYIKCIFEDSKKYLWVGTTNGLNRFDVHTNVFVRYKHSAKPGAISSNNITCIYGDKRNNIWVGTEGGGLNRFNSGTNSFTHFRTQAKISSSISSNTVHAILQDKKRNLWIATDKGLDLFSPNTKTFKKIISNKSIKLISEDGNGNLWLGTNDAGLLYFNPSSATLQEYKHSDLDPASVGTNLIRCLLVDSKNQLWSGGVNGGLNLFNRTNSSFYHYFDDPDNPKSLSQRTISALYEDNQGNLWVGTHRGGINVYMPKADKFRLFRRTNEENSLSYNDVKAFCEDKNGNIWIGTDGGGLNLFKPKTSTFKHYRYNPFNSKSIGSDAVLHLLQDSKGSLWISTWGGGLNRYDPKSDSFTRYTNVPGNASSLSSNFVQQVYIDSRNKVWVATYFGGLNLFDESTGRFSRIIKGDDNSFLKGKNVVSLAEDKSNNLWIGTDDGGLNCYNTVKKTFRHYFTSAEKMPDIRVLFIDSKQNLWVGHAGLYKFDRKKNAFYLFTEKAGLATEFIKGLAEDKSGNLWISTSNGLTRLDPQTLSFKKYNTGDGLQGLEFEANASLKTRNGELYFGGVNGFNSFYPQNIGRNNFIPPVYITSFQIFNKEVVPGIENSPLDNDISFTKKITLQHDQSTLSFGFAALNYSISENNQYAYKLEGFDKNWIQIGSNRRAFYTNLDPGTYTFKVIASNNDGIWNNKGAELEIIITPPFWDTWWFKLLVLLLILGSGYKYLSYKRESEIRQLEEKKKEELQQLQLQFFTNISHEFRTPLSLILGPLEKLLNEDRVSGFKHYYTIMYRNANRLMGLINELMDFRKIETGALKLKVMRGNLDSFVAEITDDFRDLADERQIDFRVKAEPGMDVWFDRQVLEKIVLNLLQNSFKYTGDKGTIEVEVLKELKEDWAAYANTLVLTSDFATAKYFYIRVIDNGIGISKDSISHLFQRYYRITDAHLGSGVGLAFVKSLTFLHKGNIYVSSEKHQGTELIIAIPAEKESYSEEERWIPSEDAGVKLESIQFRNDYPFRISGNSAGNSEKKDLVQKHLLIVDDNEELRTFLKDSLHDFYKISEACNGKEGIKKAKSEFPDLIISDVMMPDMDGIEFCRLVKDDIETSHIPFLMLTAKNTLESEIEGVGSGADFYFSKPVSINLLLLTIRNIFGQKQKLIDFYTKNHHAEVKELVHSVKDKEFMDRLLEIIEAHLVNPELDIELLCSEIGMSRTKLYQKIKNITGQPIGEFIRSMRLRKAMDLMTHEDITLSEVMYRVGIQTQSYFTKAFKKEFGKTPTQFLQELSKN